MTFRSVPLSSFSGAAGRGFLSSVYAELTERPSEPDLP